IIINLLFFCVNNNLQLSFVTSFSNLQEINFSFHYKHGRYFENFKELQYITFPKLQILKFYFECPQPEYVIKFLEINGKNLKEFYMHSDLSLSIAEFCPNLKKLFV